MLSLALLALDQKQRDALRTSLADARQVIERIDQFL
jgi:hypothetical protein